MDSTDYTDLRQLVYSYINDDSWNSYYDEQVLYNKWTNANAGHEPSKCKCPMCNKLEAEIPKPKSILAKWNSEL